eukprot:6480493-Amphidinium_carterae.3
MDTVEKCVVVSPSGDMFKSHKGVGEVQLAGFEVVEKIGEVGWKNGVRTERTSNGVVFLGCSHACVEVHPCKEVVCIADVPCKVDESELKFTVVECGVVACGPMRVKNVDMRVMDVEGSELQSPMWRSVFGDGGVWRFTD